VRALLTSLGNVLCFLAVCTAGAALALFLMFVSGQLR